MFPVLICGGVDWCDYSCCATNVLAHLIIAGRIWGEKRRRQLPQRQARRLSESIVLFCTQRPQVEYEPPPRWRSSRIPDPTRSRPLPHPMTIMSMANMHAGPTFWNRTSFVRSLTCLLPPSTAVHLPATSSHSTPQATPGSSAGTSHLRVVFQHVTDTCQSRHRRN